MFVVSICASTDCESSFGRVRPLDFSGISTTKEPSILVFHLATQVSQRALVGSAERH